MFSILALALFSCSCLAQNCRESETEYGGKIMLPSLYRSKVLQSPLYRFKVIAKGNHSHAKQSSVAQDFQALRDKCLQDGGALFEDPEFETVDSSLFYNETNADDYDGIEWLRPHEINKNPKFIVNGSSRFDIKQGAEGDCWFMAVLANIASDSTIMAQVVPTDQSFEDKYCGIFHFRFWQLGHWVDVVIDDRLPTKYDELYFAQSSQDDEFWSALVEKAYAKLYGSYEALQGGFEYEAMEDMTGGIVVSFDLNELLPVPNLFEIMQKVLQKQSIITAEIEKEEAKEKDLEKKGLPNNHAYSITNVKSVLVSRPKKNETVSLVRVRNPWGKREWTGPWRDGSEEWKFVSDEDKKELGLKKANDGEYWMTYEDFVKNFDAVRICLFNPNFFPESPQNSGMMPWEVSVVLGEWVRKSSAGGCSVATLHLNPQYQLTLEGSDDGKLHYLFVALMQESQRALRNFVKQEEKYLPAGFIIYKLENSSLLNQRLSSEYINTNKWFETSKSYADWRDVTQLFRVPAGNYVIIPCVHHQDVEGEFILRVVTEKKNYLKRL